MITFPLKKLILDLHSDAVIIHGACRGADLMAETAAKKLQRDYMGFPSRWAKQGKRGGPIRNSRMLLRGNPDLVIAFHKNLEKSKGTKDMVQKARRAGIPVEVLNGY